MRWSIAFSGSAGTGVNTAGILLASYLAQHGLQVLGDKEYASIIKGDNNIFVVYMSDERPYITKNIDLFFPFDTYGIKKNEKIYTLDTVLSVAKEKELSQNIIAFAMAFRALGLGLDEGLAFVEKKLGHKKRFLEKNQKSFRYGYEAVEDVLFDISAFLGEKKDIKFLTGNELIAMGAIEAGMDFYAAYPMTPASSLINHITKDPEVIFFQGEDEIAVAMAMLGAKFAGRRAMCGTSGGGFALMTETISYSNQAEIGGVYILAQRAGPSTGTPTFTEQADITFALNASFGDTKPIVLAPSAFAEGYFFISKALNRSDIYQHPIIMLTDKQFSESYINIEIENLHIDSIDHGKNEEAPAEDFMRYAYTDDGISPYSVPGVEHGEFNASSYEHTISGSTTEDPEIKVAMTKKRAKKLETFVGREFNDHFAGYEIINSKAKKFFITYSCNRYVLENLLDEDMGLIIIKVLQPFDARLKVWLDEQQGNIKKLIFVEMNYSGQLETLVTQICGLGDEKRKDKIQHYRKYSSYPIFEENIIKEVFSD